MPKMEHLVSERDGNLSILTLARGKANALNHALIEELCGAVAAAAADDSVRGLVLASGRPRFFSGGFHIREVFTRSEERRGGKEGRSWWSPDHLKKKKKKVNPELAITIPRERTTRVDALRLQ